MKLTSLFKSRFMSITLILLVVFALIGFWFFKKTRREVIWGETKGLKAPLVLFDFDGTLCDSFDDVFVVLNDIADEYGFSRVEEGEIAPMRKLEALAIFKKLGISKTQLPFVVKRIRKELEPKVAGMDTFPGIRELIKDLKSQGYTLAILTTNSQANVQAFLKKQDLEDFVFIYSGSSVFGKDYSFGRVLKHTGLSPSDVLYVGDETRDVDACQAKGIAMAAVSWGYNEAGVLAQKKPKYLCKTAGELALAIQSF